MQIGERLDIGERVRAPRLDRLARRARVPVNCCSALSSRIGKSVARADADGDAFAFAVAVELDLRRRRDESEIAAPRVHLVKSDPILPAPDQESARRSGTRQPAALWSSAR